MRLTEKEVHFLTALVREQNQTGCRGPAHELLRQHVYPDAPWNGPGSLAFSYDAVPLTGILLEEFTDLEALDEFLRKGQRAVEVTWPWSSAEEYRTRREQARREWKNLKDSCGSAGFNGAEGERTTPWYGHAG